MWADLLSPHVYRIIPEKMLNTITILFQSVEFQSFRAKDYFNETQFQTFKYPDLCNVFPLFTFELRSIV